MHLRSGTRINIEIDTKPRKGIIDNIVIFVHYVLRSDTLLASLDSDWHTVFIGAADVKHIFPLHPQIPDIYVRRHIDSSQMADMDRAVRIRKGASHQCTFVFIIHNNVVLYLIVSFPAGRYVTSLGKASIFLNLLQDGQTIFRSGFLK